MSSSTVFAAQTSGVLVFLAGLAAFGSWLSLIWIKGRVLRTWFIRWLILMVLIFGHLTFILVSDNGNLIRNFNSFAPALGLLLPAAIMICGALDRVRASSQAKRYLPIIASINALFFSAIAVFLYAVQGEKA
jgi:hypothetical protein